MILSTRLWWEVVQGHQILAHEGSLPVKSGIRVMIGWMLMCLSCVLWNPALLYLFPFGIAFAFILGTSTAIGIRRRQHYGRLPHEQKLSPITEDDTAH